MVLFDAPGLVYEGVGSVVEETDGATTRDLEAEIAKVAGGGGGWGQHHVHRCTQVPADAQLPIIDDLYAKNKRTCAISAWVEFLGQPHDHMRGDWGVRGGGVDFESHFGAVNINLFS